MFCRGGIIYILYTDDSILSVLDEEELSLIIADIKVSGLDITEWGDIENFLWVHIDKVYIETYHISHTQLINQIISNLVLSKSNATSSNNPTLTKIILGKYYNE